MPKDPSKKPRAVVTNDAGAAGTDWRTRVQYAARHALGAATPLDGALSLRITFILPRPTAHFGTAPERPGVSRSAPRLHEAPPRRRGRLHGHRVARRRV